MSCLPTTSTSSYTPAYGTRDTPMTERKLKKPIMEKMRRQRMNESLDALKEFLLKFEPQERNSKLEKADILERTVLMLHALHGQNGINSNSSTGIQSAFDAGHARGLEEGFAAASRSVFDYLTVAMPQMNNPHAQHFHMGLVTQLRNAMPRHPYPASNTKVPSIATVPSMTSPCPTVPTLATVTQLPSCPTVPSNAWYPPTPTSSMCSPETSPERELVPSARKTDSDDVTLRKQRKRVWQPWH